MGADNGTDILVRAGLPTPVRFPSTAGWGSTAGVSEAFVTIRPASDTDTAGPGSAEGGLNCSTRFAGFTWDTSDASTESRNSLALDMSMGDARVSRSHARTPGLPKEPSPSRSGVKGDAGNNSSPPTATEISGFDCRGRLLDSELCNRGGDDGTSLDVKKASTNVVAFGMDTMDGLGGDDTGDACLLTDPIGILDTTTRWEISAVACCDERAVGCRCNTWAAAGTMTYPLLVGAEVAGPASQCKACAIFGTLK
jgi:hypothetical protein